MRKLTARQFANIVSVIKPMLLEDPAPKPQSTYFAKDAIPVCTDALSPISADSTLIRYTSAQPPCN